jgi:PAS domain S-box-containing protein
MTKRDRRDGPPDPLRARAERLLREADRAGEQVPTERLQEILHELQVHQVELEIQNEELRRIQLELEESRDRYRDLYDFAPVGYVGLDAEGRVLQANLTAATFLRCERKHLIGQNLANFVGSQDQDRYYLHIREVLSSRSRQSAEVGLVRRDGTILPVGVESLATVDEESGTTHIRIAVSDISERLHAEDERQALEAQFRHAQKLESLGVLAGGIAHDFNNLLMAILGNCELLEGRLPPESPERAKLACINAAAKTAADLTAQLLTYSGTRRTETRPFNLSELVASIGELLRVTISKKASFRSDLAPRLPAINGDPAQISQVIMNLITNASEALGSKPGEITVRTGIVEADRFYLSQTYLPERLAEGAYVFLEVGDSGAGMDEVTKSKIFDPFFSTKFVGRGLGLAAALGIVRAHGGTLAVYSEPGWGTLVRVLLPASRDALDFQEELASAESRWRASGCVLVADDDPDVRVVVEQMLKQRGFDVLTASDGQEALEIYGARGDGIAVVLLDVTMPRLDGLEAARELRRLGAGMPIVMMSGYAERQITAQQGSHEATGFLQKPFTEERLATVLRGLLRGAEVPRPATDPAWRES